MAVLGKLPISGITGTVHSQFSQVEDLNYCLLIYHSIVLGTFDVISLLLHTCGWLQHVGNALCHLYLLIALILLDTVCINGCFEIV